MIDGLLGLAQQFREQHPQLKTRWRVVETNASTKRRKKSLEVFPGTDKETKALLDSPDTSVKWFSSPYSFWGEPPFDDTDPNAYLIRWYKHTEGDDA